MTCDVIEVTTRRGKREEEGFYGLEESGREQQERRLKEENKKRRRRRSGRLPWPLLRGRVRRLSKQVAGFDNNPGWSLVPRPRVSACSPAAIQQLSSKATVVLRKLGGSLDSPSPPHTLTPSPAHPSVTTSLGRRNYSHQNGHKLELGPPSDEKSAFGRLKPATKTFKQPVAEL